MWFFRQTKPIVLKKKIWTMVFFRNEERYCKKIRSVNKCGRKYITWGNITEIDSECIIPKIEFNNYLIHEKQKSSNILIISLITPLFVFIIGSILFRIREKKNKAHFRDKNLFYVANQMFDLIVNTPCWWVLGHA